MDGERARVKIEYQPANEYVAVRMRGNYMKNAGIIDGSLLIVHMQRYYDNGDLVCEGGKRQIAVFSAARENGGRCRALDYRGRRRTDDA